MPKELYFKIDGEKRDRIYQAAFQEFSSNVFNEASINKIVKNADISRGSFYQYFEDKQDIYFYILDTILEKETYSYIEDLIDRNNNIFDVFRKLLIFNLELFCDSKYSSFFEKLYLSLNYDISSHMNNSIKKIKEEMLKVGSKSKKYNRELINILQLINRDLLSKKVIENYSYEDIMEIYDIRIDILN